MLYLKKVILALKDGEDLERFLPLTEKLRQRGIPVLAFLACEELPTEEYALYITDSEEKAAHCRADKLPVLGFLHGEQGEDFGGIEYVMETPEEVEVRYLERVLRRCLGIPWDILQTKRCLIRETTVEDVDSFFDIYSHPDIVRYTEQLYPEREQEKQYIKEYIDKVYRYFEFGVWTVLLKETGEVIGRAGFSVREGYELPELGFVIGIPWQGRGIAYEICSAILQYGKEEYGFDWVQALVLPQNAASLSLCRKLGFAEREHVKVQEKDYLLLIREPRT